MAVAQHRMRNLVEAIIRFRNSLEWCEPFYIGQKLWYINGVREQMVCCFMANVMVADHFYNVLVQMNRVMV